MLEYQLKKVIDCSDWDQLITETYGKPYCFQQQDGCQSRGSIHLEIPSESWEEEGYNEQIPFKINSSVMGVKFETWLNTSIEDINNQFKDQFATSLFWDRNFYPNLQTVANDLYKKGLVEEGVYTLEIDW